jgi:hypothetical protein
MKTIKSVLCLGLLGCLEKKLDADHAGAGAGAGTHVSFPGVGEGRWPTQWNLFQNLR